MFEDLDYLFVALFAALVGLFIVGHAMYVRSACRADGQSQSLDAVVVVSPSPVN